MVYTIHKFEHRALPIKLGIFFRRTRFRWLVKFDNTAKYNLFDADQLDINKLVGVGYLWGPHRDSARFGWRWDTELQVLQLWAYCYISGNRIARYLCDVTLNREYLLDMQITDDSYYFNVQDSYGKWICDLRQRYRHKKRIQYRLGSYFGGNEKAPHDITISLRPV